MFEKIAKFKKTHIIIVALSLIAVLLIGVMAVESFTPFGYVVLFSELAEDEAVYMLATLTDLNIPASRLGGDIYIPANREPVIRAYLTLYGLLQLP